MPDPNRLDEFPCQGYITVVIKMVVLTERARKHLRAVPGQVLDKFDGWVQSVEAVGLEEVRKIPGFHDEPLKGERKGQRSVRLNRVYRAIYVVSKGTVEFVSVEEVIKHEY
jgi:proteic killer suppression protein